MSSTSSPHLIEYRCNCGKLLFKGLIYISTVEIKCKRCGVTRVFRGSSCESTHSFMLVVDNGGRVVDACDGIMLFELSRQYVVGKFLSDILPLVRDAHYQRIINTEPILKSGGNYQIRNNTLLLRDRNVSLESHIVPIENGLQYRIFNIIKNSV